MWLSRQPVDSMRETITSCVTLPGENRPKGAATGEGAAIILYGIDARDAEATCCGYIAGVKKKAEGIEPAERNG